jgi:uncharacterized protein (DUF4213/DUF364 family)
MAINQDYLALAETVADRMPIPDIAGLYLPLIPAEICFRDEFGFVFLADGSVGPFYVSLGDTLARLRASYPDDGQVRLDTLEVVSGFAGDDPALRALALGAFNALSMHVMRRAAFGPPAAGGRSDIGTLATDRPVGMVGYFCPLVERLLAQGAEVVVLEEQPQRVGPMPGVRVTTETADLGACGHILCTASTLINETLEELLAVRAPRTAFELIGPSGSGLPDVLFRHGVDSVGGILFEDRTCLLAALRNQESWGSAGRKYRLTPADYPGVSVLLARIGV